MRIEGIIHANGATKPSPAVESSSIAAPRIFSIVEIISDEPRQHLPHQVAAARRLADLAHECVLEIPMENFTRAAEELAEIAANNDSESSFSAELDTHLEPARGLSSEQEFPNSIRPCDATIVDIPECVMIRYGLEQSLRHIFQEFRSPANAQEIDALIEDRANELEKRNIDAEKLAQLLHSAERRDTVTSLLHGAVQGAAPLVCAALAFDLALGEIFIKHLSDDLFAVGAAAGAFQGAVDVIFGNAMQQAFDGAYYTKVGERNLSPMMLQLLKERAANASEQRRNLLRAVVIPYSVRNVLRAGIDVGLTATAGPASVPIANLVIDSLGGLAAGAGMRYMLNRADQRAGRMHMAYLLARTDWLGALMQLDEGISIGGMTITGPEITSAALGVLRNIPSGIGELASGPGMAELGVLTVGIAALLPAQGAAGQAVSGHGPVVREAVTRIVNTAGMGVVYAGLAAGISAASLM